MVMDIPLGGPGSTVDDARRTSAREAAVTEIPWTRIDLDLYEVTRGGTIAGYVEVVGPVFVALAGSHYDRAVEVAQHLTFHAAVDAVRTHAR